MNLVSKIITSLGAIALLSAGIFLAISDRAAAAAPLLGFGFLFVVLLLLAKFKRFKGFGFEAEMWEEKQEEAAVLVERLTLLSATISQQVALIAAKLGLWSSGLTFKETMELLEQMRQLFSAIQIPQDHMNRILAPLYDRIEMNYWFSAQNLLNRALAVEMETINRLISSQNNQERQSFSQRLEELRHDQEIFQGIPYNKFTKDRSLGALTAFGRSSRSLAGAAETLRTLEDLHLDLEYFKSHRAFRRSTDLSYLLAAP
jgi:hypothetical protein